MRRYMPNTQEKEKNYCDYNCRQLLMTNQKYVFEHFKPIKSAFPTTMAFRLLSIYKHG